jgi:hypothetical protein
MSSCLGVNLTEPAGLDSEQRLAAVLPTRDRAPAVHDCLARWFAAIAANRLIPEEAWIGRGRPGLWGNSYIDEFSPECVRWEQRTDFAASEGWKMKLRNRVARKSWCLFVLAVVHAACGVEDSNGPDPGIRPDKGRISLATKGPPQETTSQAGGVKGLILSQAQESKQAFPTSVPLIIDGYCLVDASGRETGYCQAIQPDGSGYYGVSSSCQSGGTISTGLSAEDASPCRVEILSRE